MSTEGAELWREGHNRERDAQRQDQLQVALQDATTPEERNAIVRDAYAKDPSKVKQFVENLGRRLVGKQPQAAQTPYAAPSTTNAVPEMPIGDSGVTLPASAPVTVTGPAPRTRQEAFAGHAARGKAPQQQALDQSQAQTDIANRGQLGFEQQEMQQKQKAVTDLIQQYVPKEQQGAALEDYARKQAGISATLKNIPGAAGQPVETYKGSGQWVRPVQSSDGTIAYQAMPEGWAPPAPKPQPKIGTSGGKNVYGTLTPQGWVDSGTGAPLKDFRPLPTYAQTGNFTPVETINNGQPGVGSFNRKTGKTTVSAGGATPLPTGVAKDINSNLQAAIEANTRLRTMQQNATDALTGNQQAMLSLVANHIGMTLGQQKGARINQAVWNEAVQSTPWLQGIEAKWGPDGYLKGVTLSPQQINQMLELAKQRQQDMWTQAQQSAQAAGVDLNTDNLSTPDGKGSPKGPAPKKGGHATGDAAVDNFLRSF